MSSSCYHETTTHRLLYKFHTQETPSLYITQAHTKFSTSTEPTVQVEHSSTKKLQGQPDTPDIYLKHIIRLDKSLL